MLSFEFVYDQNYSRYAMQVSLFLRRYIVDMIVVNYPAHQMYRPRTQCQRLLVSKPRPVYGRQELQDSGSVTPVLSAV